MAQNEPHEMSIDQIGEEAKAYWQAAEQQSLYEREARLIPVMMRIAQVLLHHSLAREATAPAAPDVQCRCGGTSHYAGRPHERHLHTLVGEVVMPARVRYQCDNCGERHRHVLDPRWRALHRSHPRPRPQPALALPPCSACLWFHPSRYRPFKDFSPRHAQVHRRREFPKLLSYSHLVTWMPAMLVPLCAYLHTRQGQGTGLSFIDSTKLRVCANQRIAQHPAFPCIALTQKYQGRCIALPSSHFQ